MTSPIFVLGEALMDCIAQPDGQLRPLVGGSPFNMARAAALHGATVAYLNPLSTDWFGQGMARLLQRDGVQLSGGSSVLPTSLAVVQVTDGQPSYGFYREGIADRDFSVNGIVTLLRQQAKPGIFHTGSLLLIPPEDTKIVAILKAARELGWTVSGCRYGAIRSSSAPHHGTDRLAQSQRRGSGKHGFCAGRYR